MTLRANVTSCDAAILWCFDNRFNLGFEKISPAAWVWCSLTRLKIAGGAKSLASPEQENDREFVLEQIRKSMQLTEQLG